MSTRRNFLGGAAALVAPASAAERTEPPCLAEDEATKEARQALRESVRVSIRDFVYWASAEDAWLMGELLTIWSSQSLPFGQEVYLASAFQTLLDREERYIKVPHQLRDQVVELVKKGGRS